MLKVHFFVLISIFFLACNAQQRLENLPNAKEGTAPFSQIDFKAGKVFVTLDNQKYQWLKLDTLEISEIVASLEEELSSNWKKRFSEDLVEYLNRIDIYPKSKETFTLQDSIGNTNSVVLKFKTTNRELAKRHFEATYDREIDYDFVLSAQKAHDDIDQLENLIQTKYSYAFLRNVDVDQEIRSLKESIGEPITTYDLALKIGRLINKFGDGHSRIHNVNFRASGSLPFNTEAFDGKIICTKDGKLLNEYYPFLKSINGLTTSSLLEISKDYFTQNASPQFKENASVSRLNRIGEILKIAGSTDKLLTVVLESKDKKSTTIEIEMSAFGSKRMIASTANPFEVKYFEDIGYLKIKSMVSTRRRDAGFLPIKELENSKGIIIDVRGNGGGQRDIMIALAPHFISQKQGFVVGNVARLRTNNTSKNFDLSDRYLYQQSDSQFSEVAKGRLESWSSSFSPSLALNDSLYSELYYLYIEGHTNPKFANIPTVILLDEGCYSATDIFLSTFKEIEGVTLIGTASGGGSGRSLKYRLDNSAIEVRLSSIASFQPNGDLYDGVGVAPDIEVKREGISELLELSDSQLNFAIEYLNTASKQ